VSEIPHEVFHQEDQIGCYDQAPEAQDEVSPAGNTCQALQTQAANTAHTPHTSVGENSSNQGSQVSQNASRGHNVGLNLTGNIGNLNQASQDEVKIIIVNLPEEVSIEVSITKGNSETKIHQVNATLCSFCNKDLKPMFGSKVPSQPGAYNDYERTTSHNSNFHRGSISAVPQSVGEPSGSQLPRVLASTTTVSSKPSVSTPNVPQYGSQSTSQSQGPSNVLPQDSSSGDARSPPEELTNAIHTTSVEMQPITASKNTASSNPLPQEPSSSGTSTRPN
jgi:hypothetical protein